jgi:hypothetical protein
MQALISTIEPRQTGYRVAQVVAEGETFPVASELFWTEFPSNFDPGLVPQDNYWYDPSDQTIKEIPQPQFVPEA